MNRQISITPEQLASLPIAEKIAYINRTSPEVERLLKAAELIGVADVEVTPMPSVATEPTAVAEPPTAAEVVPVAEPQTASYMEVATEIAKRQPVAPTDEQLAELRRQKGWNWGITTVGCIELQSANDAIIEAREMPNPIRLYPPFWNEGEIACLFADSNVGKSILAVQIADHIALNFRRVVHYYDFELTKKQFQMRYTVEQTSKSYIFSPYLRRPVVAVEGDIAGNEDSLMNAIEQAAVSDQCSVIIIDNLTCLCNNSESGDTAGRFMARLMELKKRLGLSVLVIAHTPKRDLTQPISQNDLAGSKRLFNFFDSVFAMGKSAHDNTRYIKQIKTRMGILEHGIDNVLTGQVVQYDDGFLCFEPSVTCDERHLLDTKSDSRLSEVAQLRSEGLSIRKIAEQLGVSKSVIGRMVTDYRLDKAEVIAPGNA
ncbi:MAG: AAA family ATPase [Muribaculaceae bacterium]|nr:AAA family ATPase [Muribaculaceae bacterium]